MMHQIVAGKAAARKAEHDALDRVIGMGIALAFLGIFTAADILLARAALAQILVSTMIAGGIFMVVHAVVASNRAWALLRSCRGFLYIAAATSMLGRPDSAAALLAFWLVAILAVSGVMGAMMAIAHREDGGGWTLASALVAIGAACMIAFGWPSEAPWVLGMIMAVDFIAEGMMLALGGLARRRRLFASASA